MKKEIYITILLFAFMLFALASTMVRGEQLRSNQFSSSLAFRPIDINVGAGNDKFLARIKMNYHRQWINSSISLTILNRGLQVVNWSSRSLFALLHSRGLRSR